MHQVVGEWQSLGRDGWNLVHPTQEQVPPRFIQFARLDPSVVEVVQIHASAKVRRTDPDQRPTCVVSQSPKPQANLVKRVLLLWK